VRSVVDFLSGYDPSILERIEPADPSHVDIIDLTAGPLPTAYLDFLETMGGSTGPIDFGTAILSARAMAMAYGTMSWLERSRYLRVGGDRGDLSLSFYLDLESAPDNAPDFSLVRLPFEKEYERHTPIAYHASLEEFLAFSGFYSIRMGQLPMQGSFSTKHATRSPAQPSAADTIAHLEAAGFVRTGPTVRCAIYERDDDVAAMIHRHPVSSHFVITFGCSEEPTLEGLAIRLRDSLGLAPHPGYTPTSIIQPWS
jgi:hypothetical protein